MCGLSISNYGVINRANSMKSKNKFVYVVVIKLHKYLIIHDNIELTSSITKGEEVV